MEVPTFHYVPRCSMTGCNNPAPFKIASPWSDGTSRELKNYGLACADHQEALLSRARKNRSELVVTEGELVGPVGLYELVAGIHDVDLPQIQVAGST